MKIGRFGIYRPTTKTGYWVKDKHFNIVYKNVGKKFRLNELIPAFKYFITVYKKGAKFELYLPK